MFLNKKVDSTSTMFGDLSHDLHPSDESVRPQFHSERLKVYLVCLLTAGAMAVCGLQREAFIHTIRLAVFQNRQFFREEEVRNMNNSCERLPSGEDYFQEFDSQVEFYWSRRIVRAVAQAFVISSFVFAVPAGVLADQYGAKWVIGVGLGVSAITAGACPSLSKLGAEGLFFARFAAGFSQALVFPSSVVTIVQWSPVPEQVTLVSIVTAGEFIGYGLAYALQPNSWEWHYYTTAGVTTLLVPLWFYHVPNKSRLTSRGSNRQRRRPFIPWKAILTSPPVLSLLLIHWASCWLINFLVFIQSYFIKVIGLSEGLGVFVATFAEFSIGPSTIMWGVLSDYLVNNDYMSRTANRKTFIFSSNVITAVFLVLLPVAGCSKISVVVVFLSLCYFRGLYCCMFRTLPIDLSPRHSGLLMSLIVSTSSTVNIFSWDVFKTATRSFEAMQSWRNLCMTMAVLLVLLSLPFLRFGSADVQPWNSRHRLLSRTLNFHPQP